MQSKTTQPDINVITPEAAKELLALLLAATKRSHKLSPERIAYYCRVMLGEEKLNV